MTRTDPGDQLRVLRSCLARADLTTDGLWRRYFALGGEAGPAEVGAYLRDGTPLPAAQADLLAQAVNERLDEIIGPRRVPYSHTVRDPRPTSPPHKALVGLLDGMHMAPPQRLAAVAATAGRALGVRIAVYLVDYEQRSLRLLPGDPGGGARDEVLGVDTTLAGRAFRRVTTLPSSAADGPRLWVPLLDGVERLGVLDVRVDDEGDLRDPGLREQMRQLSALMGHLADATGRYGDGLDATRRSRPRTAAAELVWHLLPPTTAGTDRLTVSGMVEPAYDVGGDAFDYALSESSAQLAVFDATGHALGSGIVTAAALAAYRAARRNGSGLFAQADAVDDAVAELFAGRSTFVTGALLDLDLVTGRLRHLVAGHPPPLVLRDGRVVRTLGPARRPPFGIRAVGRPPRRGPVTLAVGEEALQPGDWLVLHTDGITEARDRHGVEFGEDRLADFLSRRLAAGHPPPETVRRLVTAVLDHQGGVLQDDASLLLAHWHPPEHGAPPSGVQPPAAGRMDPPGGP